MLKNEMVDAADVSAVIALSGDVQGCVVLSFPRLVDGWAVSAFADTDLHVGHAQDGDLGAAQCIAPLRDLSYAVIQALRTRDLRETARQTPR